MASFLQDNCAPESQEDFMLGNHGEIQVFFFIFKYWQAKNSVANHTFLSNLRFSFLKHYLTGMHFISFVVQFASLL